MRIHIYKDAVHSYIHTTGSIIGGEFMGLSRIFRKTQDLKDKKTSYSNNIFSNFPSMVPQLPKVGNALYILVGLISWQR